MKELIHCHLAQCAHAWAVTDKDKRNNTAQALVHYVRVTKLGPNCAHAHRRAAAEGWFVALNFVVTVRRLHVVRQQGGDTLLAILSFHYDWH